MQINTGYSEVGTFVVEKEDSKSVAEAIAILIDNCPKWDTSNFMIYSSEIEAVAIKLVFPGKKTKIKIQRLLNLYVANIFLCI